MRMLCRMMAIVIYLNICARAGRANSTDLASWLGLFSHLEILESWRGTDKLGDGEDAVSWWEV